MESGKTLKLENLTLQGGIAEGADEVDKHGGSILVKNGSVTMGNCTLKGNQARSDGGAIYTVASEGTASAVTISGGTGEGEANAATGKGGGIYVNSGCTLTLNEYTDAGGTAHGVQIIGNTAQGDGGGVYLKDGTYTMSGSATVTPSTGNDANLRGKNDIYLPAGKKIILTEPLNPASGIAGRITPEHYTGGTVILSGAKAQESKKKFTITRETSGGTETDWGLTDGTGNDAVLEKTATTFGEFTDAGDFTKILPPVNGVTGHDPTYPLPYNALNEKAGVLRAGRTVKLSPYTIGKTAVTYKLWKEVYGWARGHGYTFANPGSKGSHNNGSDLQPVVFISWRDCIIWCNAYTEKTKGEGECVYRTSAGGTILKNATDGTACDAAYPDMDKKGYRLPTEAEWEYAARWQGSNQTNAEQYGDVWLTRLDSLSGATKPAAFENTQLPPGESWPSLRDESARVGVFYNWWDGGNWQNLGAGKTSIVGSKAPNYMGLYDMSGNVHVWCFDWYSVITGGTETDPQGPSSGTKRVLRGGTFESLASTCAVGNRGNEPTSQTFNRLGLRVVCRP